MPATRLLGVVLAIAVVCLPVSLTSAIQLQTVATGLASPVFVGHAGSASSQSSWIAISGASSGSGSGVVNYAVQTNSGKGARNGKLTVAGIAVTIKQSK